MFFEELFDDDSYNCGTYLSTGVTHTYLSTGGWRGGCASFTLPVTNQGYSAVTNFGTINSQTVNIRYIMKLGAGAIEGDGNKNIIIYKTGDVDSHRSIGMTVDHIGAHHTVEVSENVGDSDSEPELFRYEDYIDAWVCLEYEVLAASNIFRVYVTTPDGACNETICGQIGTVVTTAVSTIQVIGGYWGDGFDDGASSWWKLDSVLISTDGYIGPPLGFVESAKISGLTTPNIAKVNGVDVTKLRKIDGVKI